jgi:hypothetical protein
MNKLLLALILVGTSGCTGIGRGLIDAGGAAGGAYLGHGLSGGDPGLTVAGAAGGVLLTEGAQSLFRVGQKRSYKQGYLQGQSDAAKKAYWQLQDAQQRVPK